MNELADRPLRVKSESPLLHWWRLLRWFGNLRLAPRWREAQSGLFLRALRRYFFDGLTRPGKTLFVCSLLTFLFSYRSESSLFITISALGFSLLLWSIVLGRLYRPRLTADRSAPLIARAGQTFTSQYRLRNEGPRALNNFIVREQVVPFGRWPREWERLHQHRLDSTHELSSPVDFVPTRRGRYQLSGISVQSYFPFFLNRFSQQIAAPTELFVLPEPLGTAVPSLRRVAEQASKRLQSGTDNSRKGPSLEYAYSRPYQAGDSLRRLDHRAASRLGIPMSKVFEGTEEIRRDQVYLIIDLSLQDFLRWQRRPLDQAPLERRLALAVELGLSAQHEGFSLAALATGADWHPLTEDLQFEKLIATCEADKTPENSDEMERGNLPESVLNDNGLHILVLGRWTAEAQDRVESWQRKGILCLIFLLPEREQDLGTLPPGSTFVEIPSTESDTGSRTGNPVTALINSLTSTRSAGE